MNRGFLLKMDDNDEPIPCSADGLHGVCAVEAETYLGCNDECMVVVAGAEPSEEICNGGGTGDPRADDDCDGLVDEGTYPRSDIPNNIAACDAGEESCVMVDYMSDNVGIWTNPEFCTSSQPEDGGCGDRGKFICSPDTRSVECICLPW